MNRILSSSKALVLFSIIGLFILPVDSSYAAAGCCSKHGGVDRCDTSTNHFICKDGNQSATCLCDGSKAIAPTANTAVVPVKKANTTKVTKTRVKKVVPAKTNAAAVKPEPKTVKAKTGKTESTAGKTTKTKTAKTIKTKASKVKTDKAKAPKAKKTTKSVAPTTTN